MINMYNIFQVFFRIWLLFTSFWEKKQKLVIKIFIALNCVKHHHILVQTFVVSPPEGDIMFQETVNELRLSAKQRDKISSQGGYHANQETQNNRQADALSQI